MSCSSSSSTTLPSATAGRGISTITRTAGTGLAGSTDTYTITYTDGTTSTYTVVNGANGAAGSNGTNGNNGIIIKSNNITVDTPVSGAFQTLKSYSLSSGVLTQDGDALEVTGFVVTSGTTSDKYVKLMLAGVDAMPTIAGLGYLKLDGHSPLTMNFKAVITRKSATTVFITYEVNGYSLSPFYMLSSIATSFYEASITINNMDSLANLIDLQGATTAPDTIVAKQLMVKYLKKE
jgi:hypothetical protein